MASPTITPTDTVRCGYHHTSGQCPPVTLDELLTPLSYHVPVAYLAAEPTTCTACGTPHSAVATVVFEIPTPAHLGFRYRIPVCVAQLIPTVVDQIQAGHVVTVEVPALVEAVA